MCHWFLNLYEKTRIKWARSTWHKIQQYLGLKNECVGGHLSDVRKSQLHIYESETEKSISKDFARNKKKVCEIASWIKRQINRDNNFASRNKICMQGGGILIPSPSSLLFYYLETPSWNVEKKISRSWH